MIVFVFVVVVAVVVGVAALALHGRSERGIESGISSFRRELDALAPRGDTSPKPPDRKPVVTRDDEPDEVRTVQIGDRPPPRRPTPSVRPTGVPAPTPAVPDEDPNDSDDEERPPDARPTVGSAPTQNDVASSADDEAEETDDGA